MDSFSSLVRITFLLGKHPRITWWCHGTKFRITFVSWDFFKIIVEPKGECLFAFPLACSRKFCNSNHNLGKQCAYICLAQVPKQGLVFLHTHVSCIYLNINVMVKKRKVSKFVTKYVLSRNANLVVHGGIQI